MYFKNTFKNKKVLVTGHSGFKGSWLAEWLQILGAKTYGISKDIPTKPSHFKILNLKKKTRTHMFDLRKSNLLTKKIKLIEPDFIFHLAAQSLVKKSYDDPVTTWQSNLISTLNLLESLRHTKKKITVVIITSDKCYLNDDKKKSYKENDILGGIDPYSASKASCEILINSYVKSFFNSNKHNINICSARAGNVIGGGDWSLDRLIPDYVKSWKNKNKLKIRGIKSTRPWQHVLEAISGYLTLADQLSRNRKLHGHSFNFGPLHKKNFTVNDVLKGLSKYLSGVKYKVKKNKKFKESNLLSLNSNKAKKHLSWKPNLTFNQTIEFVGNWYKNFYLNKKIITKSQIILYQTIAKRKKLNWTKA